MSTEAELIDEWRSLAQRYHKLACALDRALDETHGVSMNEFETLDRLLTQSTQPCDTRMQDLAGQMYLSQSALSRTVARLEKAGFVERTLCEADRRGVFVRVTDAGRELYRAASQTRLAILGSGVPENA
ncbi:MarR family transcriptional regulator [Actinokineospora auranticolor]|uniref:DNA-binding MarR family transcriptional regulator n=1 Tax=Actinokineospora auranticolor TaxID=155976 RepID=A0A2S6GYU6_9PSEU|nr:MarR family transcriptional regulator [Actinokineospora auranticolor]PPK70422.1 DNA-binding MarR family transcriptional regulator [Actinokineospora auranticolor]